MRDLARELDCALVTVSQAYELLAARGRVQSRVGKGTFVAPTPPTASAEADREAKLRTLCGEFLAQAARFGFSPTEVVRAIEAVNLGESS